MYSDPVLLLFENNIVSIICFYFIFSRAIKTGMIWIEQYHGDKSALWTVFFQVSILGIVPLTSFMEIEIVSLRCFDTVFQRPYWYFSIALKVVLSLSDRYKIFTSNWLWIEISENVVLSKIDDGLLYDNNTQKSLKLIKAEFCVI